MRYEIRIRRLKVVYYIGGSLTKRANKRQKRIGRRVRENTIRIARNQMLVINLKTALLQIRSYIANGKKRQVKNLFYIRSLIRRSQAAKAGRKNLAVIF